MKQFSRSGHGGPTVGKSWGKYKIPKIRIKGFTDTEESDVSSTESYYRESESSESDVDEDDPNDADDGRHTQGERHVGDRDSGEVSDASAVPATELHDGQHEMFDPIAAVNYTN